MDNNQASHYQVGETQPGSEDVVFVTRILVDQTQEVLAFERRAFKWATVEGATVRLFSRNHLRIPKTFICFTRADALLLCAELNTYF
jgi:hypothetical protein